MTVHEQLMNKVLQDLGCNISNYIILLLYNSLNVAIIN